MAASTGGVAPARPAGERETASAGEAQTRPSGEAQPRSSGEVQPRSSGEAQPGPSGDEGTRPSGEPGARPGGATQAGPGREPEPRPGAEGSRRGRTRERLLDAAYDVFAEQGVHAATVEGITERAGFTRGAFYSNFTTKEELFFALMERENGLRLAALREQVEVLQPRIAAALSPVDEATLGEVILDLLVGPFDDRKWCLVQGELRLLAMRDREVAPRLLAHQRRFWESLSPIVLGAVQNAGREFVVDVRLALGLLASIYEDGLEASILAGGDVRDVAAVRTDLARTVLVLTRPLVS